MDTLEFFQRVLPSTGLYVLAHFRPKAYAPSHKFFDNLNDMVTSAQALDQQGHRVYHALASYREIGSRSQENSDKLRSFFIDIDCGVGKPFPDWKAGLKYLGDYVARLKLPKPMVIFSGSGLHVYWTLDADVDKKQWLPVARALKNSFPIWHDPVQNKDVPIFDPVVPADSARILRPVGITNRKNDKVAKLLIDAPHTTLSTMASALADFSYKEKDKPADPIKSSILAKMAVQTEYPPADGQLILQRCQQLAWLAANQNDVSEPLWYAMLGVAAYCENPEQTAIEWSKEHADFDQTKTLAKMHHWKSTTTGPATCAKFASEHPSGCKGCVFKDKIGSPARLGIQYEQVEAPKEAPDIVAQEVPVPSAFKRTAKGMVIVLDGIEIELCDFEIYPVSYGRDEGTDYEVCRYHWNRPNVGWQELVLRQSLLVEGNLKDFITYIADHGIVTANAKKAGYLQILMREYMDELRKIRTISNIYSSMGWKEDDTQFLLGDILFKSTPAGVVEESINVPGVSTRRAASLYRTAGDLAKWVQCTQLLEKANMPIHMFVLGVSFSAPLYKFAGLNGLTVNLFGPTGAGKSLAQRWMQSIWGDPNDLHMSVKTTQNALFSRYGMHCHLPVTIDEATMLNPKEVGDLLYSISQGQDKARLTRQAQIREPKVWATPTVMSSNRSIASMLAFSGMDSDAQAARLLELSVDQHPIFADSTSFGEKVYQILITNYGHAGRVFAKHLMQLGPIGIRAAIAQHKKAFAAKYGAKFAGHERYWEQVIILADLANKWAFELGLISYNYTAATIFVLSQLGAIRSALAAEQLDTFDLLAEYFNEFSENTLTVVHNGNRPPMVDTSRIPRGEVHIRFDMYRKDMAKPFDRGTVMLDRKHFKIWLSSRGVDYRSTVRVLDAEGINATPPIQKSYLGKYTDKKLGQQYVLGVNLNHERLRGILTDAEGDIDEVTLGQLRIV